jgi:hypothetical protein
VKAREWYERGQQASDPIDALSYYWRGFNNMFFPVNGRTERDKIKRFIAGELTASQATDILEKHRVEIDYLLSRPVIDMRGNKRDTDQNAQAFKNSTDALEKLTELFLVIYQVRCNLEHGQKSPSRDRDQVLCRCASPIVAHVIDICA